MRCPPTGLAPARSSWSRWWFPDMVHPADMVCPANMVCPADMQPTTRGPASSPPAVIQPAFRTRTPHVCPTKRGSPRHGPFPGIRDRRPAAAPNRSISIPRAQSEFHLHAPFRWTTQRASVRKPACGSARKPLHRPAYSKTACRLAAEDMPANRRPAQALRNPHNPHNPCPRYQLRNPRPER